ncbi:NAD(P)H-binding protein [Nocardiopsis rhodophaea]|uniref:NAD(P)H-binding protein n=1 Tax=Nocardiopsis rhodophaea TaxID=280238 RepID=A0ABP5F0Q4_9ACTN
MKILVTGATGTVGRALVDRLLESGQQVRALTRDARNASHRLPPEAEVSEGNFDDPGSLRAALEGVDRMYLFSDAGTVHNVMTAVKEAGLDRMAVLTSAVDSGEIPDSDARNPVKEQVRESGVDWTFLEPGPFAMNARDWWAYPIREFGVVRWVYPESRLASIHEADVADAAAVALLEDDHVGREYTLSGPEALTQAEQVEVIGRVIGRDLVFQEIGEDEAKTMLARHGVPAVICDWLMTTLASLVGAPAEVDDSVERITGRPGRTFEQWVADHADIFRAPA